MSEDRTSLVWAAINAVADREDAMLSLRHALVALRSHAYSSGRTLNEVAGDVVAGRLRLHPNGRPRGPGPRPDGRRPETASRLPS
ncbi:hypothetical protein [Actinomadura rupiterrae]|uniref:hypothetical protein n=1 Tax=Actinomadura rupiterrae TaxID=559627 RepID=UPI0020A56CF8|nr:hypothetical protein [Actinomadura rupiterrae]MCP2342210.1 hypothetical protein [Actinomadura rupiterrae]